MEQQEGDPSAIRDNAAHTLEVWAQKHQEGGEALDSVARALAQLAAIQRRPNGQQPQSAPLG
ncbi:MAG TPA: hypothetical protein VMY99_03565 [Nevskiaceae bacterium]|nr:hypothetical protein [Nevskiaceae bacterium]